MKNKYLFLTIVFSIAISIIPFIIVYIINNFSYPNIPIEFMDDSLYYYSRAIQVVQGNFFIGNSYIYEHIKEVTPAFFVADWIWSIPLILSFSLVNTIFINQIFWFGVLAFLLFRLFKKLEITDKYSFVFTIITLISSYWFVARPVAMQVVFPVFVLFILNLISFLKDPKSVKKIILLAISASLSVYIYTYLTQIIFVIFAILCILSLLPKWKDYRSIWPSGFITIFVSIPFLMYTWLQINHPLYFETLYRIGLVETHSIGTAAIFYLFLIITASVSFIFVRKYIPVNVFYSFLLVSFGLFIATISNVFTGKDLETAVHIGRFVEIWTIIIFLFVIYILFKNKTKTVYLFTFLILLLFGIISFVKFQVKVWGSINKTILRAEVYYEPIIWLSENTPRNSIVLADDIISSYIPLFRNNYVVFHPNSELYIMSDDEVESRYLLSRIFQNISIEDIKNDMRKYAGAGYTAHRHATINRNIKICYLLKLDKLGKECGQFTDQYELKGEKYFDDLEDKYKGFVKNPEDILKEYKVSYILVDTREDNWVIPESIKKVWSDGRFEIYKI